MAARVITSPSIILNTSRRAWQFPSGLETLNQDGRDTHVLEGSSDIHLAVSCLIAIMGR